MVPKDLIASTSLNNYTLKLKDCIKIEDYEWMSNFSGKCDAVYMKSNGDHGATFYFVKTVPDKITFSVSKEVDENVLEQIIKGVDSHLILSYWKHTTTDYYNCTITLKNDEDQYDVIDSNTAKKLYNALSEYSKSFDYSYDQYEYNYGVFEYLTGYEAMEYDFPLEEKLNEYLEKNNVNATLVKYSDREINLLGKESMGDTFYIVPDDDISIMEHYELAKNIAEETGIRPHGVIPTGLGGNVEGKNIDFADYLDGDANCDSQLDRQTGLGENAEKINDNGIFDYFGEKEKTFEVYAEWNPDGFPVYMEKSDDIINFYKGGYSPAELYVTFKSLNDLSYIKDIVERLNIEREAKFKLFHTGMNETCMIRINSPESADKNVKELVKILEEKNLLADAQYYRNNRFFYRTFCKNDENILMYPDSDRNKINNYIQTKELQCEFEDLMDDNGTVCWFYIKFNNAKSFDDQFDLVKSIYKETEAIPFFILYYPEANISVIGEGIDVCTYTSGDANCDGQLDMADAVLVMQSFANPDKYGENGSAENHLTELGIFNADMNDDGLTVGDAQAIQELLLGLK